MELCAEMTQGDPYYDEIAFTDPAGVPTDLTGWTIDASFRTSFASPTPLVLLTMENGGLGYLNANPTGGAIYLQFDADTVSGLYINPTPRNGQMVPSVTIVGDIKLVPPDGVELVQGTGARATIFLTVKAGLT